MLNPDEITESGWQVTVHDASVTPPTDILIAHSSPSAN
jgi:hypothetical protein